MERGDLGTFESVEDSVLNGESLLWLVWNAPKIEGAAVTSLGLTEKSKVCTIVAFGGDGHGVSLISKIEGYAKDEGCDCVRIFGRKGWLRRLKDYSAPKVLLEKRLT